MDNMKYKLYKGLQSPLVFKGFKGKYIYWGMGAIALGVLVGAVSSILFGALIGIGILAVYLVVALVYIFQKQKKGLYSRRNDNDTLFVIKNNLK